jgi:hypothetical protein
MIRSAIICLACLSVTCGAASAQADGTWRCIANGNIPLGLLSVTGTAYTWTKTNASFQPVEARENGSGTIRMAGSTFTVESGPLLNWGVTGALAIKGVDLNNRNGTLAACR